MNAAEARQEHEDFMARIGDTLVTGTRLKTIMLKEGLDRYQTECPRCGEILHAGLVRPKNHLRMACEGDCGMNMLE